MKVTTRPARRKHRRARGLLAVLIVGGLIGSATPAFAVRFTALEIFPPEGRLRPGRPALNCQNRACKRHKYDNAGMPRRMPHPSLESRVIMGVVTKVVRGRAGRIAQWKIGSGRRAQWVFRSRHTRLDNTPRRTNLVKVIAVRSTRRWRRVPLIAERVTDREPGRRFKTRGVGAPEIERGFLWTARVVERGEVWTIRDLNDTRRFATLGGAEPTEVEPGVVVGKRATVQFIAGRPAG